MTAGQLPVQRAGPIRAARAEHARSSRERPHRPGAPLQDAVIIAIVPELDDRMRLARMLDRVAPLVLVGNAAEARRALGVQEAIPADDSVPVAELEAAPVAPVGPVPPDQIGVAGLWIDTNRHVARYQAQEVSLTPLEHELMLCLVSEPGRVWTFARLHQQVWGGGHLGVGSHLHSVVKRVRRKLGELSCPVQIEAVRGVGFRLEGSHSGP